MKRFAILAVTLVAVAAMAVPAFALDFKATGSMYARGFMDSNASVNDATAQSDTYMDMRLRVNPVLTVTDNLSISGRVDIFEDVVWGTNASYYDPTNPDVAAPNFDRLWMTIKTDYGKFDVGRLNAKTFGTLFMDSNSPADRIKYSYQLNEVVVGGVYEKGEENDGSNVTSDSDYNKYFLFGDYNSDMIKGGLLMGFYEDKSNSDNIFSANPFDREFWFFNPYAQVKVDDITVSAEAFYNTGKWAEYDQKQYAAVNNGVEDLDYDALAWNLEARYNMGPFDFQAGYAWLEGQGEVNANTDTVTTLGTLGKDWQKLWILTGNEDENVYKAGAGSVGGLGGGWGNLSDESMNGLGVNGAKIFYVGAGFKPVENLSLNILYGNAKAEAPLSDKWSDNYGSEYDFNLVWNIMDNLSYTFIAAYLDAGDFFKDSAGMDKVDNTYSLFHKIEMTF